MYFITAFEKLEPSKEWFIETGSQRTFGYYDTFEKAERAVINNYCDIHEYLYDYCLIEKIDQGIHATCLSDERWLYKFDSEKREYYKIDEIPEMQYLCNFALG